MSNPSSEPQTAAGSSTRITAMVVGGVLLLAALWVGWDLWNRRHETLVCDGKQRYAIDARQFATQYQAYSVQLEANLSDKGKVALKLDPVQQQKLSEALLSANEFRKYLVAGFNACAVTEVQYAQYGGRFQALDSLARQIDELSAKPARSPAEDASLSDLITRYAEIAHGLGTE